MCIAQLFYSITLVTTEPPAARDVMNMLKDITDKLGGDFSARVGVCDDSFPRI